jgi:plasmid stabilization system protein ParE
VKRWNCSGATVQYLVRLADRAFRDLDAIYEFIEADSSDAAFEWFNRLSGAIYSLEQFAERGSIIPEDKKLRHLLFEKKPDTYRIIYAVNKRNKAVNVLHIRHSARAALSIDQERDF